MGNNILVMGVGNLVLKDEGVGIHAIQELEGLNVPGHIDLLDGGTGGIFLIGTLQEYKHLILIDATLDDYPPGTIRRIKPHYSDDYPTLLSAHEIGLKDMIDAMILQESIPEIDLVVMSVKEIGSIGMELSPEVKESMPRLLDTVFDIIHEIDTCS